MQQTDAAHESHLFFLDYLRVIKSRWLIVTMVFLLVMIVVAVVTLLQPKIYMASARINVEYERPTVAVFEREQYPTYDPYFLQTQYEVIQSQKTLNEVIKRLSLEERWGKRLNKPLTVDVTFRMLKQHLAVRRYRDTSLIEIAVMDEDPVLAADTANMIAEVFELQRLEVRRDQTLKGVNKLREEVLAQQERVRLAQDKIERLRKELDISVLGIGVNAIKPGEVAIQQLQQQLTLARVEAASSLAKINELQKLTPRQLRNAVATIIINDPNVQALLQNLSDAELRLEVLKQDYGPDHPNVRSAQAAVDKLGDLLDERLEGVKRGFEVSYQAAQARVDDLQKQLDDASKLGRELEGERFLPFRNAQREEELETKLYEVVKQRLQQESIQLEVPRSPVEVVDRAQPARTAVKPNLMLNLALGTVVGLMLGVALAFFIELLDTSIKKMEEVEKYLGLPVLGVVPRRAGLICRGEATPAHIEAYRMLRASIEFATGNGATSALCIMSAGEGEGKSFTVANLACVYAQHNERVLVVDADLRRPSIHKLFGANNDFGLADYLMGNMSVEQIIQPSSVANVWVIASGQGNPPSAALPMLTSQRMRELIRTIANQFDVVLYDTPPVLGVSDAALVAREVGSAVLVVHHRRFPRNMARRARQLIDNAGSKLLGVVVNNVDTEHGEAYQYYYGHYEQYLRGSEPKPQPVAAAKTVPSDEINLRDKY